MTKRKKDKTSRLEDMSLNEALARFIQTDPKELEDAYDQTRREEEEAKQYADERRESIRKGARRARKRFRL